LNLVAHAGARRLFPSLASSSSFSWGIIQLQTRAKQLGGNAVIDIKSHSGEQLIESSTNFSCNVGNIVARVKLTGTPVKLK